LKETLTIVYGTVNETSTNEEITYQQTVSLQSQIYRGYEALQSFRNITNSASLYSENITLTQTKLISIEADLDFAISSLNIGNLAQANQKIEEANRLIDEVNTYLNSFAITLKTSRLESYIASAEQRLLTLQGQLNSVSGQLSPTTLNASSAVLNNAQVSLTKAKGYLNNQQINLTIGELATVKSSEETVAGYINTVSPTPTPLITPKPNSSVTSTPNVNASLTAKSTP
jgi:paraquat-inducible protein B